MIKLPVRSVKDAAISGCFPVFFILLFSGCQGPVGPPGMDAEGVDVTPPTIELVRPHPLSQVWDEFDIVAAAVDNVAIREVLFTFDGSSLVNNILLLDDSPPYEFTIEALGPEDVRLFESGWHFIAARAYDTAGNVTDSPLVPIQLGYSEDLQDTVVLKHHNGVPFRGWTLPDTAGATAYWSRFNTPVSSDLISISLMLSGSISDSTACLITVWEGNLFPENVISVDTLLSDSLSAEPVWSTLDLNVDSIEVEDDFFVMVGLEDPSLNDSLILMADNGLPPWRRSGSYDDHGMHLLRERYSADNNFLISCKLFYEVEEPPDTTVSLRSSP